jgi:hypothetical protein
MIRSIPRGLAAALFGALAGPACLLLAYAISPEITFGADRLASISAGFYPAERAGTSSFAWTSRRADLVLAGLDRRSPWSCAVRFRGARPDPAMPQPDLTVALDGVAVATSRATNEFQQMEVTVPVRPLGTGLILTLTSSTTFTPGASDRRPLGVQIEDLTCRPTGTAVVLPPRRAMASAALASAVFGAALGLTGITAGSAIGGTILLAAGQALPLASGAAPYGDYPTTMVWIAAWIALLTLTGLKLLEAGNGQALRNTARFVVLFSAGVLYLKLLGLSHPSKALVDALFHAHRLEAVLAGRFYFTQLSTSATPFPYAIGLYLFAAPWSWLTRDHVMLLRVVVCASEAIAGGLVYLMVVRTWGDRLVAAVAVALVNLVPVSYAVVGNANLTNAFGESAALVTIAAVTVLGLQADHRRQIMAVSLLATLALLSHVTTLTFLLATLVAIAVVFRWMGAPALRVAARSVLVAATIALVLSVLLYWGHFGGVYQAQLARVRTAPAVGVAPAQAPAAMAPASDSGRPRLGRVTIPLTGRVVDALDQTVGNLGWPIVVLALAGAWRLLVRRARDRLSLVLAAWGMVGLAFVAASVVGASDVRYQQDAFEFIGRVEHATCPVAVILAAYGAIWAWRAGTVARLASSALLVAAVVAAVRVWAQWL